MVGLVLGFCGDGGVRLPSFVLVGGQLCVTGPALPCQKIEKWSEMNSKIEEHAFGVSSGGVGVRNFPNHVY